MRVAITGASGNVGTALIRYLRDSAEVDEIVGICRRPPQRDDPRWSDVHWVAADVVTDDLTPHLHGADALVHLAWLIQPSHRPDVLQRVNVAGSRRTFRAAIEAAVPTIVHASSVGTYSAGPKDRPVDEAWPRDGVPTSEYSRDKAQVEAILDALEADHPQARVVRLRPGLIFQRAAGSEIVRYFMGRFVPARLLRPGLLPVLPLPRGLAFQAVHVDDVAAAYHAAIVNEDARGAYNVAAGPVLDAERLGAVLGARPLPLPPPLVRAVAELSWRLHLQPTEPGWLDLAMSAPVMDCGRAAAELSWQPRHDSMDALRELLAGIQEHAGGGTPVLARLPSLPRRLTGADRG
ncbi:MAG: NAD-dependent epimerase/dehydratase family protein [Frankiaceae bacterium]